MIIKSARLHEYQVYKIARVAHFILAIFTRCPVLGLPMTYLCVHQSAPSPYHRELLNRVNSDAMPIMPREKVSQISAGNSLGFWSGRAKTFPTYQPATICTTHTTRCSLNKPSRFPHPSDTCGPWLTLGTSPPGLCRIKRGSQHSINYSWPQTPSIFVFLVFTPFFILL